MTDAIVKIMFSDGKEMFRFYIGSDSSPDSFKKTLSDFCNRSDVDTVSKKGRINWDYVASNFMRYIADLYTHKDTSNMNRVKVLYSDGNMEAPDVISGVCNIFTITPDKLKYADWQAPLILALNVEVN